MIVYQASKTSKKELKREREIEERAKEGKRYDKVFRDGENKFNGL